MKTVLSLLGLLALANSLSAALPLQQEDLAAMESVSPIESILTPNSQQRGSYPMESTPSSISTVKDQSSGISEMNAGVGNVTTPISSGGSDRPSSASEMSAKMEGITIPISSGGSDRPSSASEMSAKMEGITIPISSGLSDQPYGVSGGSIPVEVTTAPNIPGVSDMGSIPPAPSTTKTPIVTGVSYLMEVASTSIVPEVRVQMESELRSSTPTELPSHSTEERKPSTTTTTSTSTTVTEGYEDFQTEEWHSSTTTTSTSTLSNKLYKKLSTEGYFGNSFCGYPFTFECSPGICISMYHKCDTLKHCPNGEDELPEVCIPTIMNQIRSRNNNSKVWTMGMNYEMEEQCHSDYKGGLRCKMTKDDVVIITGVSREYNHLQIQHADKIYISSHINLNIVLFEDIDYIEVTDALPNTYRFRNSSMHFILEKAVINRLPYKVYDFHLFRGIIEVLNVTNKLMYSNINSAIIKSMTLRSIGDVKYKFKRVILNKVDFFYMTNGTIKFENVVIDDTDVNLYVAGHANIIIDRLAFDENSTYSVCISKDVTYIDKSIKNTRPPNTLMNSTTTTTTFGPFTHTKLNDARDIRNKLIGLFMITVSIMVLLLLCCIAVKLSTAGSRLRVITHTVPMEEYQSGSPSGTDEFDFTNSQKPPSYGDLYPNLEMLNTDLNNEYRDDDSSSPRSSIGGGGSRTSVLYLAFCIMLILGCADGLPTNNTFSGGLGLAETSNGLPENAFSEERMAETNANCSVSSMLYCDNKCLGEEHICNGIGDCYNRDDESHEMCIRLALKKHNLEGKHVHIFDQYSIPSFACKAMTHNGVNKDYLSCSFNKSDVVIVTSFPLNLGLYIESAYAVVMPDQYCVDRLELNEIDHVIVDNSLARSSGIDYEDCSTNGVLMIHNASIEWIPKSVHRFSISNSTIINLKLSGMMLGHIKNSDIKFMYVKLVDGSFVNMENNNISYLYAMSLVNSRFHMFNVYISAMANRTIDMSSYSYMVIIPATRHLKSIDTELINADDTSFITTYKQPNNISYSYTKVDVFSRSEKFNDPDIIENADIVDNFTTPAPFLVDNVSTDVGMANYEEDSVYVVKLRASDEYYVNVDEEDDDEVIYIDAVTEGSVNNNNNITNVKNSDEFYSNNSSISNVKNSGEFYSKVDRITAPYTASINSTIEVNDTSVDDGTDDIFTTYTTYVTTNFNTYKGYIVLGVVVFVLVVIGIGCLCHCCRTRRSYRKAKDNSLNKERQLKNKRTYRKDKKENKREAEEDEVLLDSTGTKIGDLEEEPTRNSNTFTVKADVVAEAASNTGDGYLQCHADPEQLNKDLREATNNLKSMYNLDSPGTDINNKGVSNKTYRSLDLIRKDPVYCTLDDPIGAYCRVDPINESQNYVLNLPNQKWKMNSNFNPAVPLHEDLSYLESGAAAKRPPIDMCIPFASSGSVNVTPPTRRIPVPDVPPPMRTKRMPHNTNSNNNVDFYETFNFPPLPKSPAASEFSTLSRQSRFPSERRRTTTTTTITTTHRPMKAKRSLSLNTINPETGEPMTIEEEERGSKTTITITTDNDD